jgi:hypothetical protein
MTFEERAHAVAMEKMGPDERGFTARQARFLAVVMLHAGVCMKRHYLALHGCRYGHVVQDFFQRLVQDRVATPYGGMHTKARVYHVHHRRLYAALGEPHSRLRKPMAVGRAMERLMLLDVVLQQRDAAWLATEDEKLQHFTARLGTAVPREWLPHVTFGEGPTAVRRYFTERLPIAVEDEGRRHTFVFLVTRPSPVDLRAFLHNHAELLRALPHWHLRVFLPPHLRAAQKACLAACLQELASPLRPAVIDEIRWYFEERRALEAGRSGGVSRDAARFDRATRAFSAPRFRALFRTWRVHGPRVLDAAASPVLADALERRVARIDCEVLERPYLHLSSLVGTA